MDTLTACHHTAAALLQCIVHGLTPLLHGTGWLTTAGVKIRRAHRAMGAGGEVLDAPLPCYSDLLLSALATQYTTVRL